MKKFLILTAAFVMGTSVPALAFNPSFTLPNSKPSLAQIRYSSKELKNKTPQTSYVEGTVSDTKIIIGKQDLSMADGNLCSVSMNGLKTEVGDKIKFGTYYGKPTKDYRWFDYKKFWGANASTTHGKLNLSAGYDKLYKNIDLLDSADSYDANDKGVWNFSTKYTFDDASLSATLMKASNSQTQNSTKNGIVIAYTIKEADQSKPGSWGLWGKYYNQGYGTIVAPPINCSYSENGFLGWGTGINYALSKHTMFGLEHYNLKSKNDTTSYRTWWTNFNFTF